MAGIPHQPDMVVSVQSLVLQPPSIPHMETPDSCGNSLLEMYTGIVCACMPCLTPLIKRHFPGLFAPGRGRQLSSLEAISTTWRQTTSVMTASVLREDLQWHERRTMTTIGHTSETGPSPEARYPSVSKSSEADLRGVWQQSQPDAANSGT